MVLGANTFNELCYLYPKTAVSLKYRSLDRRNYFLKTMQAQEIEYGIDRDPRTGLKIKTNKIQTLEDEIIFKEELGPEDYSKI